MNDDVPARDAQGRTSFYAEKTAQSLYTQLGFTQERPGTLTHRTGPGPGPSRRSTLQPAPALGRHEPAPAAVCRRQWDPSRWVKLPVTNRAGKSQFYIAVGRLGDLGDSDKSATCLPPATLGRPTRTRTRAGRSAAPAKCSRARCAAAPVRRLTGAGSSESDSDVGLPP
jgi:hypothetical protein